MPRAARECYKWLLCPVQHAPTDPKPIVEAFPLTTGGGSTGSELERGGIYNELVITTWSAIHLRTKLTIVNIVAKFCRQDLIADIDHAT